MKVKICEKCKNHTRYVWTQKYKPANYHTIGINHAYGFCIKYNKRCLDIKKCEV